MSAQADTAAFLKQHASAETREDVHEVLRQLELNIIPILDGLAFGILAPDVVRTAAFLNFDKLVLAVAAADLLEWREFWAPAVLTSHAVIRMKQLYRHIVRTGVERSLAYSDLRRALQSALLFYFDFAALLGVHFVNPAILAFSALAIFHADSGYRPRTQWDARPWQPFVGVPDTPQELLAVSAALVAISRGTQELRRENLEIVYFLMTGWTQSPHSSAKTLISDQIVWSVCPQLPDLVARMAHAFRRLEILVRIAVALMEACRPGLPMVSRRGIRDEIGNWDRERLGAVRIPDDVALTDPSQYAWDLGLSGPDIQGRVDSLLRGMIGVNVTLIASRRDRIKFTFTDDGESTPRAWGRALGLSILHDVSLTWLRLDAATAGMLHPRLRQAAGNLETVSAAIVPTSTESLIHVNCGLEEVMGRGGLEMFMTEEWMALFGLVRQELD